MDPTLQTRYPSDMTHAAHHPLEAGYLETMANDMVDTVKQYAREKPTSAILWAAGIGFVLGWKLKPW